MLESVRTKIRELGLGKIEEGSEGWEVFHRPTYGIIKPVCLVNCKSKTCMDDEQLSAFKQIRDVIEKCLKIEFVHVPIEE